MPRITFLVPTFNRANFIAESIASISSQMTPDDELLVIDDGSTDDTARVVGALPGPVRYIRQDNAGKSAALNRGLACSEGQYVWVCDDDDILRPDAVRRLLGAIERTGADMVFGRYTRFRTVAGRKVNLGTGYWPDLSKGSLARHILEDSFVMHNASLVRRTAYDRAGPFDESMLRSLDYEMFVRLALRIAIAFEDSMIFEQRKHEGARGPARALHAAGKSDEVWGTYDRRIFASLTADVPLAFFGSMFEATSDALRTRAALLQRAAVLGRHDLWGPALDDIQVAAGTATEHKLTSLEREICRRGVAGKHGFPGLIEAPSIARLSVIMAESEVGREIVGEFAKGSFWRLRDNSGTARRDALALITNTIGLGGVLRSKVLERARVGEPDECPLIVEKTDGLALLTS